jgi:hypothetical protein
MGTMTLEKTVVWIHEIHLGTGAFRHIFYLYKKKYILIFTSLIVSEIIFSVHLFVDVMGKPTADAIYNLAAIGRDKGVLSDVTREMTGFETSAFGRREIDFMFFLGIFILVAFSDGKRFDIRV